MNVPLFSRATDSQSAFLDHIVPEICVQSVQLTRRLASLKDYRALQSVIGPHAQTVLDRIVADLMQILPQGVPTPDMTCFEAVAGNMFQWELQMYQKTLCKITDIWMLACTGDLSQRLGQDARQTDCAPQSSAFDRAVAWIHGPASSPEMQSQTARALQQVIQYHDVRSRKALIYLGRQPQTDRAVPKTGESLCSEDTLQAIWTDIEAHAMGFQVTPGDEDPDWDDLACFLYGACLRAQGSVFAARAIYAATLLKGGRPFRAPERSFETFLRG